MNNQLTTLTHAPKKVGKWFGCDNNRLTDLQGAPQVVGHSFSCKHNLLMSLQGGPTQVGGGYDCRYNPKLKSLDGLPIPHMGDNLYCDYKKDLPLLRLLNFPKHKVILIKAPKKMWVILEKYMGSGRSGAIKCAAELIRAGYKENAKW